MWSSKAKQQRTHVVCARTAHSSTQMHTTLRNRWSEPRRPSALAVRTPLPLTKKSCSATSWQRRSRSAMRACANAGLKRQLGSFDACRLPSLAEPRRSVGRLSNQPPAFLQYEFRWRGNSSDSKRSVDVNRTMCYSNPVMRGACAGVGDASVTSDRAHYAFRRSIP